jgi:2-polyprenyl-3-methyl-5-hydroxy-6-metoxy-1,4-benzoquinol methylase
MDKNPQNTIKNICPICAGTLTCSGRAYSLDELLDLWKPVTFSNETINEHSKQSGSTQLYICANCQFEIFYPQIIGTPNFYVELLEDQTTYIYSEDKWDFKEAFKEAIECKSAVEIGCGPGNFLEKIKPYVLDVAGTEYNERALTVACSKGLKIYSKDDATETEKAKGKFDIAFSFHVLEHVPDPIGFIQDMLSWVGPCGKIGISVPNMDGPIKYIDPCVSNMPPHHATRWTLRTFKFMAAKLNLKLERVAFEPLNVRDQYYYSDIVMNHLFPGGGRTMRALRFLGKEGLQIYFKCISFFGKNSTSILRGQSIYVVFSKNN